MVKDFLNFKKIEEVVDGELIDELCGKFKLSEKLINNEDHLIIGENYYALNEMKNSGEIFDVIYIDPPYNTGSKDFRYNDKYVEVDDEDRHSRWLSFMDKRLELAKAILSKKGCLILSIGEDELHNIAILLKKHFKFVSEPIIWLSKQDGNNNKSGNITNVLTDFVLIAYDDKNFKTNEEIVDLDLTNEFAAKKMSRYPLGIRVKYNINEYPLEEYNGKMCRLIPSSDYSIEPYNEKSYKGHRFQKRTAQKGHGAYGYKLAYDAALIENEDDFLMVIDGVKDKQGLGIKFQLGSSYFQSIPADKMKVKMPNFLGYYQGGYKGFQTAKPVELIKRLLRNTTNKNSKILDFFAGTGTTLIAVNEINKEDNGNRRCVIVTNNDADIAKDYTIPRLESNLIKFKIIEIKQVK